MNFKDLQAKGKAELQELLKVEQAVLHGLKIKSATKQLKQVHLIKEKRNLIARIMTVLHSL